MKEDFKEEIPLGLAFQMATNENAMAHFGAMSKEERKKVMNSAKSADSKEEMRKIVENLDETNRSKG